MNRREFLQTGVAGAASIAASSTLAAQSASDSATTPWIRKSLKYPMIEEGSSVIDKFKIAQDAGFDGVELHSPGPVDRETALKAKEATGLTIPGLIGAIKWDAFCNTDEAPRKEGMKQLHTALEDAKALGATTVLLIPALVNKEIAYADAYSRSQETLKEAVAWAESIGITIAFENVWNNFLLSPLEARRYVDSFASPRIQWYFDVGNVVAFGWPEHWIQVLGERIVKLDVKEYSREKRDKEGLRKGFQVELMEGDCDWPTVVQELKKIGYHGWASAEVPGGDAKRLKSIAERMDKIFGLVGGQ